MVDPFNGGERGERLRTPGRSKRKKKERTNEKKQQQRRDNFRDFFSFVFIYFFLLYVIYFACKKKEVVANTYGTGWVFLYFEGIFFDHQRENKKKDSNAFFRTAFTFAQ